MRHTLFDRDEGGDAGSAAAAASAAEEKNKPDGAAAGVTTPDGEKPTGAAAPTSDDPKVLIAAKEAEIEKLNKQLGKQGTELEIVRKIKQGLKEDPTALISELAAKYNVKIKTEGEKEPENVLNKDDDDDERLTKVNSELNAMKLKMSRMEHGLGTATNAFIEQQLSQKYPDYDDLGDVRGTLAAGHKAGLVPESELYHLAAKGASLPEAIAAAKKEAVKEYIADLERKAGGQIGGGHPTSKNEGNKKFSDVVSQL